MHDLPNEPSIDAPQDGTIEEEKKTSIDDAGPAEGAQSEGNQQDSESTTDTSADADAEDERDKELPDWAREKLTRANTQAAKYRTDLRALEAKFAEAKTLDEFNAAVEDLNKMKAENAALLRENVAKVHGLPKDLADLLKGETREELEAHAKTLAKYVTTDERELGGGLEPGGAVVGVADPGELARKYGKRH